MIRALLQAAVLTAVAAAGVAWLDFEALEVAVAMVGASAFTLAVELLVEPRREVPEPLARWRDQLRG
jgi:hypothetical protein